MSFLDCYLDKNRLGALSKGKKKRLAKLEARLAKKAGTATFEDMIKQHGPEITELIERLAKRLYADDAWQIGNLWATLRYVSSIALEVYQIVEKMGDSIVNDGMSKEEQHKVKVEFGKDLVYFIWCTIDPLKGRLIWIPFKKTLEKWIVMTLAEMALENTVDLFAAEQIKISKKIMKAIP